ncbi:MAG: right-handed parallel beta-helix repeat-containing protein [Planctomycetaceae bacterium]
MSHMRDFGAVGDGQADDTAAIRHAVSDGDGFLQFARGTYRITATIDVPLNETGRIGIDGCGGTAKILMAGRGPALRFVGTHQGTGSPTSVRPNVWTNQRMPTLMNIEIEGAHPEADGIELIETMQATIEGVLIRRVRHGIRLHQRNRNVLISHSHVYHNTGVGIFLDRVNLHQINIASCHVSYNRLGGIRIEGSQVRNLQITGNDIEYNNHRTFETAPEPTAEITIDSTADGSSVAEVTIASNTIQATPSPGGANLRILDTGGTGRRPELWAISGNIIGNQETNVHLVGVHGLVLSGNFIYSAGHRNLLIENSRQVTVGACSFRTHSEQLGCGVRVVNSTDCLFSGCTMEDEAPAGQASGASLLELADCRRINVAGCQVLGGVPYGIDVERSSQVNVTGCTLMDSREEQRSRGAIRFRGEGAMNLLASNIIGRTLDAAVQVEETSGVTVGENVTGR